MTGSQGGPAYDAYNYGSLTTSSQVSGSEYLPATPDTSGSVHGYDLHPGMSLPNDPCGYVPQFQPSLYPNMPDADLVMTDPMGMRYGLDLSYLQDGIVEQNGPMQGYQGLQRGQSYGY